MSRVGAYSRGALIRGLRLIKALRYLKIKYKIVLIIPKLSFIFVHECVPLAHRNLIPLIDSKYLHISQFLTLKFEKLIDGF